MRAWIVMVVGCVPSVDETPPPLAPPPAVQVIDAAVDAPIDAPPDAPPDARVLTRPGTLSCRWQHVDASELAFTSYTFHGVVPWVGLTNPIWSSCCVLPNATVLCEVTEKTWSYIRTPGGGTAAIPLSFEHTRLFDKKGTKPWFEVVTEIREPPPMGPARRHAKLTPPIFESHVEVDQDALWIVGDRDRICDRAKVPCDEFLIESNACWGYRKIMTPIVRKFCDARGPHEWHGNRFD